MSTLANKEGEADASTKDAIPVATFIVRSPSAAPAPQLSEMAPHVLTVLTRAGGY